MLKTNVKRQSILAAIGTTVLAIREERTIAQAACTGLGWRKDIPLQFLEHDGESHIRIFIAQ